MLLIAIILMVLNFALSFLVLSAVGNGLTALRTQLQAAQNENVWHFRLTRSSINDKTLQKEIIPRLKTLLNEQPTPLEQAMQDLSNGIEPRIDFSGLGGHRG
jgi:hypothetical protein